MKIVPYLSFDGTCEAALKFYEQCLGGKIEFGMTYGESPMAATLPPEWGNRIYHATLSVGDQTLGAADALPGPYLTPQGISLTLATKTIEEADRVFGGLSENGAVQMPIQETHWSPRFGVLTDQFGIPWIINCDTAGS